MDTQKQSWLERIEDIVGVLEGSTIGELELTEADIEISIRRSPGTVTVAAPGPQVVTGMTNLPKASAARKGKGSDGVAIAAPLTGVYYSAPSPNEPPFAQIGDIVHAGQIIALIEAMKVFNEIQAEVSGRVLAILPKNGDVVQKGDALLRVEPL